MNPIDGNHVHPEQSKRPPKIEERVYLDDEQSDFLTAIQHAEGFKYRSEALRYCISREQARVRRRQIDRSYRQQQRQQAGARQPTGSP